MIQCKHLFSVFSTVLKRIVIKCQHFLCFQYCIEENCDKMSTTQAKVVACLKDQKDGLKDLQVVFLNYNNCIRYICLMRKPGFVEYRGPGRGLEDTGILAKNLRGYRIFL